MAPPGALQAQSEATLAETSQALQATPEYAPVLPPKAVPCLQGYCSSPAVPGINPPHGLPVPKAASLAGEHALFRVRVILDLKICTDPKNPLKHHLFKGFRAGRSQGTSSVARRTGFHMQNVLCELRQSHVAVLDIKLPPSVRIVSRSACRKPCRAPGSPPPALHPLRGATALSFGWTNPRAMTCLLRHPLRGKWETDCVEEAYLYPCLQKPANTRYVRYG